MHRISWEIRLPIRAIISQTLVHPFYCGNFPVHVMNWHFLTRKCIALAHKYGGVCFFFAAVTFSTVLLNCPLFCFCSYLSLFLSKLSELRCVCVFTSNWEMEETSWNNALGIPHTSATKVCHNGTPLKPRIVQKLAIRFVSG